MVVPKNMIEFMEAFPDERSCLKLVIRQRWPEGFNCPKCGGFGAYRIQTRGLLECKHCGHQVSATAGTIFHKTRTSLRKWFLAIYLMATTKKALSSAELSRQLGVALQTAWTLRRKIMHALKRRQGELMLCGVVELDETFVGGREEGTRGRGTESKTLVAVSAERTPDGGFVMAHMRVIPDASKESLNEVAKETIAEGSKVLTDGWTGYNGLKAEGFKHRAKVQGSPKNASKILPWVHVVTANFKRWILDIFHGVSSKHLQAYLDEFCYRLNRRQQRTDLFRRVLNRCAIFTSPVTYAQLIAS